MDEIICPECGRPNLVEAEKCWYCQVPLVDNAAKEDASEEIPESETNQPGDKITKTKSAGTEVNEENLPEWLKRIRELKKADTPVEEVDEWQQEKLFTGLTQDAGETASRLEVASRPIRSHEATDPKPVIPEGQPLLEEAPAEENLDEEVMPEEEVFPDEEGPDDSENELPEGFTPLAH